MEIENQAKEGEKKEIYYFTPEKLNVGHVVLDFLQHKWVSLRQALVYYSEQDKNVLPSKVARINLVMEKGDEIIDKLELKNCC